MGAVGYLIEALVKTSGVRYFATFLICAGVFSGVALTFTWVTDNQGSASKRGAGLVVFGMLGQTGAIAGSRFFPSSEGPYYVKGMYISAALLFFAALVTLILRYMLFWENKMRDERSRHQDTNEPLEQILDRGSDDPNFRFIL